MKTFFYPRLAWDGLRKNRQLSRPYLLTCICMVAVFYILSYLTSPMALALIVRGGSLVHDIMNLGRYVILVFSLIFLYYTYSFLLRRRSHEFGLYNVLGMGKRNLVRIIAWENVITFAIAITCGLFLGILLSKLAELGLVNLLGGTIDFVFRVHAASIWQTLLFYALIFGLLMFSAVIRTARANAVSLMKSENAGEKPPKGNWLFAILGVLILGGAYYIAISVSNPVTAILLFFIAVVMVIVATYLLMVTGSVKMCRILQSNKGYYYKAKHFVSVSSMAFRMKRNGAGLASICIIATMILVMLSTTTCMWFGAEDSLKKNYPREINFSVNLNDPEKLMDGTPDQAASAILDVLQKNGITPKNIQEERFISLSGVQADGFIQCDYETASLGADFNSLREIYLVSPDSIETSDNKPLDLAADEIVLITDGMDYTDDTLTLAMGNKTRSWKIRHYERKDTGGTTSGMGFPTMTVAVADLTTAIEGLEKEKDASGRQIQSMWKYNFDTGLSDEENTDLKMTLHYDVRQKLRDIFTDDSTKWISIDSRAEGSADFYGTYGSLFFIGILLSIVFVCAAVLIIYYKQISEGYEDAKRFDIMQKVGMTKKEIRSSISSQLLTVFALPLAFAGLHLIFAFPMIRKMLAILSLTDVALFMRTTLISFVVFGIFYAIVYRLTSRVYYRIVSGLSQND
ncbi:ABC transporter permease [Aristaeella hokkaidonensis]|uniref:ABC transporter permease n=1 Tax=Aristaeella hokkaidonensis TaxID=3046382 RepID=A0AC61MXL1_9FIRM|nr:ABC transporter permease [Aristaeella hokkaidonensis]QUC67705.1 ABC transporter permease [Aristaeella hokkaidonensis]SNT92754.1 putative ABC transport system permease protein [Aristaeella hokkaidonensis]